MAHRTAAPKKGGSRFGFFSDILAELKKTVWLTKREAAYLTVLVLIVAGIAGIFLGGVDYVFAQLFNKLFLGQ